MINCETERQEIKCLNHTQSDRSSWLQLFRMKSVQEYSTIFSGGHLQWSPFTETSLKKTCLQVLFESYDHFFSDHLFCGIPLDECS